MNNSLKTIVASCGAAAAVCVPAAAQTHGNGHSQARGHGADRHGALKAPKTTNVIVKGTVTSVDGQTVTVDVKRANHHGHALVDQPIQLDATAARVRVKDVNGDGTHDLGDFAPGDRVLAQLRVPRGTALDVTQPFAARRILDVGPAPAPSTDDQG